jgi:peptide/nickel transport system substrate-binding protein
MESLEQLRHEIVTTHLSRRSVLQRAMVLGLSAPVIAGLLAACGGDDDDDDTPTATTGAAESTSPPSVAQATPTTAAAPATATSAPTGSTPTTASPTPTTAAPATATTAAAVPATEVPGHGRGQADLLRIIYTNAPNILNPHLASGGHESQVASIVLEPLVHFDRDATMIPALAAEVPTLENGGLAEDGSSVTYKLRDDVVWSDGEPFTAEDVRFTWEYITHPDSSAGTVSYYEPIEDVEVVDDHTVTIHFKEPSAIWFVPFSGGRTGEVLPKHILQDFVGSTSRDAPFNLTPIGTGPYKVAEFRPGDQTHFEINENYRFADKPYFKRIEVLGGIDATLAIRSVIETGESDYTWFVQTERAVLEPMLAASDRGELVTIDGTNVERISFNMMDPNKEVDGERAKLGNPHPVLSDRAVREALTYAIDRDTVASELYGNLGKATANLLAAPPRFVSPNTSYEFNLEKAAELLDAAGWTVQDGVRQKDGVQMHFVYQTSLSPIRQKNQEVVKQAMDSLNIQVDLKTVPGSTFFSSDAGNPDTIFHFYADWEMHSNGPAIPYPIDYMIWYKSSDPERDIPQQANGWSGRNVTRWVNEEFNDLYSQALVEFDPDKQAEIFIAMNDLIAQEEIVEIPIIHRTQVSAKASKLKGNNLSPWTTDFWDIQNWYFEE